MPSGSDPDSAAVDTESPETTIPGRKPETQAAESQSSTPAANAAESAVASVGQTPVAAQAKSVTQTQTAQAAGSYVLQLAAYTSEGAIAPAWTQLQKSHPELLGDMQRFVQQVDVNGKTYYRLQVGPFPNRATALDVCAQLKARKQDCLVVKR